MLLANETVAQHLDDNDVPALYRIHEAPDPLKVEQFEEFITTLGYSLGAPPNARQAEALPEAGRADQRHAGRAADRVPDAADDAEGALRRGEPRPLRPGRGELHALHVADPPLSRSGRAPHAARVAARPDDRGARATSSTRSCRRSARHTSEMERRADEAERELVQWKKVRFMADKVGDEFDGYITGVAPFGLFVELVEHFVEGLVHVSTMADDYYRFVEQAHIAARREHRRRSTGSATGCACRSSRSTWSGGRSIWGWSRSSTPCGSPSATADRGAARRSRRANEERGQRPGRREREHRSGRAAQAACARLLFRLLDRAAPP